MEVLTLLWASDNVGTDTAVKEHRLKAEVAAGGEGQGNCSEAHTLMTARRQVYRLLHHAASAATRPGSSAVDADSIPTEKTLSTVVCLDLVIRFSDASLSHNSSVRQNM